MLSQLCARNLSDFIIQTLLKDMQRSANFIRQQMIWLKAGRLHERHRVSHTAGQRIVCEATKTMSLL